ncbi:hypothetical protein AAMO2058_000620300 [Amorphochlora amoebiformis]
MEHLGFKSGKRGGGRRSFGGKGKRLGTIAGRMSGEQKRLIGGVEGLGVGEMGGNVMVLDGASVRRTPSIARFLRKGGSIYIRDCYNSAIRLYSNLKRLSTKPASERFRNDTKRIYVASGIRGLPTVPWVEFLIKRHKYKFLSLRSFFGFNSAWERYNKGIEIRGIEYRIHPFYNVYCPPAYTLYIKMFHKWIKKVSKSKNPKHLNSALEIGSGSGVLSLLMLSNGIKSVTAVDSNEFCTVSLATDLKRMPKFRDRLKVVTADMCLALTPGGLAGIDSGNPGIDTRKPGIDLEDLGRNSSNHGIDPGKPGIDPGNPGIGSGDPRYDLVVFNPPWVPAPKGRQLSPLEQAVFRPRKLLTEFLKKAKKMAVWRVVVV